MTLSVPLPVPQGHIILAVSLVHAAKGLWHVGVVNSTAAGSYGSDSYTYTVPDTTTDMYGYE